MVLWEPDPTFGPSVRDDFRGLRPHLSSDSCCHT
jgi:hypothetical protein